MKIFNHDYGVCTKSFIYLLRFIIIHHLFGDCRCGALDMAKNPEPHMLLNWYKKASGGFLLVFIFNFLHCKKRTHIFRKYRISFVFCLLHCERQ